MVCVSDCAPKLGLSGTSAEKGAGLLLRPCSLLCSACSEGPRGTRSRLGSYRSHPGPGRAQASRTCKSPAAIPVDKGSLWAAEALGVAATQPGGAHSPWASTSVTREGLQQVGWGTRLRGQPPGIPGPDPAAGPALTGTELLGVLGVPGLANPPPHPGEPGHCFLFRDLIPTPLAGIGVHVPSQPTHAGQAGAGHPTLSLHSSEPADKVQSPACGFAQEAEASSRNGRGSHPGTARAGGRPAGGPSGPLGRHQNPRQGLRGVSSGSPGHQPHCRCSETAPQDSPDGAVPGR